MEITRRGFVQTSMLGAAAALQTRAPSGNAVPASITSLQPLPDPAPPISDQPMIAIYGEFGIRLEDCLRMTPDGPRWFTEPSASIDQPFA